MVYGSSSASMSSRSISASQSSAHVGHSPSITQSSHKAAPHISQYTIWSSGIPLPQYEHLTVRDLGNFYITSPNISSDSSVNWSSQHSQHIPSKASYSSLPIFRPQTSQWYSSFSWFSVISDRLFFFFFCDSCECVF